MGGAKSSSCDATVIRASIMDPKYSAEVIKHMENQSGMLTQVHESMLNELHKLQIEEEMLMRKLYEIMTVHGNTKKSQNQREESAPDMPTRENI